MEDYFVVNNEKLNQQDQIILNDYLLSKKLVNRSELTIKRYKRILEKVLVEISKPIKELTAADMLEYIRSSFKGYKECTINSSISIISAFFTFCQTEEYINKEIVKNRWKPRIPRSLPRYLEKIEIAKVRLESEKSTLRNKAIFEFLLCSGCRVGEVQRLNVAVVDLENRTAIVIGKGGKIRWVNFTEKCSILLEKYISTHPNNTEPVFLGRNNNRISIKTIQRIISELGAKAGLLTDLTPHRLRHTFATELLSKGAPLEVIQQLLGHSYIATTRIYASVQNEQIINLYRKYMG